MTTPDKRTSSLGIDTENKPKRKTTDKRILRTRAIEASQRAELDALVAAGAIERFGNDRVSRPCC